MTASILLLFNKAVFYQLFTGLTGLFEF